MATNTRSNVEDGIIDAPLPTVGQILVVHGNDGTDVECGAILSIASQKVIRGEPGFRFSVEMIRVSTSVYPEGIWVYTQEGLKAAVGGA